MDEEKKRREVAGLRAIFCNGQRAGEKCGDWEDC